jgi:hypothetical protein
MKISRERMNQHMSIFLKLKKTFSCILKWLFGNRGKKSWEGRITMYKRKNRGKTFINYYRDYFFISEERIFKYFEMALMNKR